MNGKNCPICFEKYNSTDKVPKFLFCGHSICVSCLKNIIEKSPQCPSCSKPFKENSTEDDFITNFGLMEVAETPDEVCEDHKNLELLQITDRNLLLAKRVQKSKAQLDEIEDKLQVNIEKLSLKDSNSSPDLMNQVLSSTSNIERDLVKHNIIEDCPVTISLKDYTGSSINNEIYNGLHEGKRYKMLHMIDGVLYSGHYSKQDEFLCVHSLKPDVHVPGVETVSLKQMKERSIFKPHIFLDVMKKGDIISKKIIFYVKNRTINTVVFFRLCIGEFGQSYKGCSIKSGSLCNFELKNSHKEDAFFNRFLNQDVMKNPGTDIKMPETNGMFTFTGLNLSVAQPLRNEDTNSVIAYFLGSNKNEYIIRDCGIAINMTSK